MTNQSMMLWCISRLTCFIIPPPCDWAGAAIGWEAGGGAWAGTWEGAGRGGGGGAAARGGGLDAIGDAALPRRGIFIFLFFLSGNAEITK